MNDTNREGYEAMLTAAELTLEVLARKENRREELCPDGRSKEGNKAPRGNNPLLRPHDSPVEPRSTN